MCYLFVEVCGDFVTIASKMLMDIQDLASIDLSQTSLHLGYSLTPVENTHAVVHELPPGLKLTTFCFVVVVLFMQRNAEQP